MEVRVENLCKAYHGKAVLQHVTFTAGEGITCIMAPSGAGKTTLLRILLGLEMADSGTITPRGLRWSAVFQEDRLLERQTAMENLRFVLGDRLDTEKAGEFLDFLGLGQAEKKPVRAYSGGMKRRLALARALLSPGDLLALDEPFTGLDEENRSRCLELLRREQRPILLVTHDSTDAQALSARIIRL